MATVSEIAPDLFRISTFVPDFNLQFNQFLVRDAEPLLFHTGPRGMFAAVRDAVATVLDPRTVRWIGFSHVEADECGSLPEWQGLEAKKRGRESLFERLVYCLNRKSFLRLVRWSHDVGTCYAHHVEVAGAVRAHGNPSRYPRHEDPLFFPA